MKDTIKKSVAYVSTGSIVFSSLGAVIGQSVFAGQIDKKLDLSSLRNDVRSGSNSFVYAVFSDLKAYLVSQGKMSSNESLYDKYKDTMINKLKEHIKRYNEEHLGEVILDKLDNKLKEYEQISDPRKREILNMIMQALLNGNLRDDITHNLRMEDMQSLNDAIISGNRSAIREQLLAIKGKLQGTDAQTIVNDIIDHGGVSLDDREMLDVSKVLLKEILDGVSDGDFSSLYNRIRSGDIEISHIKEYIEHMSAEEKNKDAIFMAYLLSNLRHENYNDAVQIVTDIMLNAAGITEKKCYMVTVSANDINSKFGLLTYALDKNSPLLALTTADGNIDDAGLYIFNGTYDNNVIYSDITLARIDYIKEARNSDVFNSETTFLFIDDDNVGRVGSDLKGIWSIDPDKNLDNKTYDSSAKLKVALNSNDGEMYLANGNGYIEFNKTNNKLNLIYKNYISGDNPQDLTTELNIYESKDSLSGLKLSELYNNYKFQDVKPNIIDNGSDNSGSGGDFVSGGTSANGTSADGTSTGGSSESSIPAAVGDLGGADIDTNGSEAEYLEFFKYLDTKLDAINENSGDIVFNGYKLTGSKKEIVSQWRLNLKDASANFKELFNKIQEYKKIETSLTATQRLKYNELLASIRRYTLNMNLEKYDVDKNSNNVPSELKYYLGDKQGILIDMSKNEILPAKAKITIAFGVAKKGNYDVYYMPSVGPDKGKVISLNAISTNDNGNVDISTYAGGQFLFVKK